MNSQATERASMNSTLVTISVPSASRSTGRRPTSSETRPASSSAASTPNAYVAYTRVSTTGQAPQRGVDAVQGRRRRGREQREADHGGGERVGPRWREPGGGGRRHELFSKASIILELSNFYHTKSMPASATTPEKIPHPPAEALDLPTILRTVGDPVRLEIVRLLADGRPRTCTQLQDALGLPASTGSYHLRLLREAGLTRTRAIGTQREITLRRDDLEARLPGLLAVLTR
jgi:DNA-binding transcriptional ArsR family regulator